MNYASSYAVGSSVPEGIAVAVGVQPAPKPHRMHWSTLVLIGGIVTCAFAVLITVAGIPARIGYDVDGPAHRNKPDSMLPSKMTESLDGNMKWIDEHSADTEGSYVGLIKSINRSEAAIPAMAAALTQMGSAVAAIDDGLAELGASTTAMGEDLTAMEQTSSASAETMDALGSNVGFLSSTMVGLANATVQLTTKMNGIETKAGDIAANGTSAALQSSKDLDAALPDGVPVPKTSEGEDYGAAMTRAGAAAGAGQQ